jgi:hypothetical protein
MPMHMRSRFTGTLLAVAMLAAPTGAHAADPGVTIDGGGPADKEYAVPLEAARQMGTGAPRHGTQGREGSASHATPLFGVGIRPERKARAAARRAGSPASSGGVGADSRASRRTAADGPAPHARAALGTAWMASIAAAVLALGIAAGTALATARRRALG